ncbi:MAG: hypothetical protein L6V88_11560 [Anaerotruncus sp.]|nr:MAG: hypothetical protein L6V88_11560 [Anaerotruncus sp.]
MSAAKLRKKRSFASAICGIFLKYLNCDSAAPNEVNDYYESIIADKVAFIEKRARNLQ